MKLQKLLRSPLLIALQIGVMVNPVYYFTVLFGHDGQKPLELRCDDEVDGDEWVEAIHQASYSDILIEREVLMQKYIHLVQIVETEKIAANQLRHQLEDQDTEIERLKSEIIALNKTKERMRPYQGNQEDDDPDIKKIKKIPRYIITLHELLAHTPHEHIERKSLEFAKSKLEELSRVMHDEVSDTENIRKNLAIERMIVEGCDILLDTSQTFIRQGGVLSLMECTLIEETETGDDDSKSSGQVFGHLDFKLVVEPMDAPPFTVVLLAPSQQEKAAWTSDISQVA
ncbi:ras-specific guanine nucleotide-releasing factor 2 [Grus japonensis]|uniref:Ras-specific guanine nucleotide-releasing factor 2 n=1 Tax=Grus japonensis TaxID=30415 RepID=A0ABC9Y7F6_GRUJA